MRRAFVLLGLVVACSAGYGASDPAPEPGTDAGTEAGTIPDASTPEGGTEDGGGPIDAGRKNLIVNGDFSLGCGGWEGTSAKLAALTSADGNAFCRVCATPGATDYSITQIIPLQKLPAGVYAFEAKVSLPTTAGTVAPSDLVIGDFLSWADGGYEPNANTTSGPALDTTWQKVTHVFTVPDGTEAGINAFLQATGGTCFLVDDAALYVP